MNFHRMVFEGTSFFPLRLNLGSSHPKSSLLALFPKATNPAGRVLFVAATVLLLSFVLLWPAPATSPGLSSSSSSVHTPPGKHKPAGIPGSA